MCTHACKYKISLETVVQIFSMVVHFLSAWSFHFWVRPVKIFHFNGGLVNFPHDCHFLLYIFWGFVGRSLRVPNCYKKFFYIALFLIIWHCSLPLFIPFCLEISITMSAFLWLTLTGIPLSSPLFPALVLLLKGVFCPHQDWWSSSGKQ